MNIYTRNLSTENLGPAGSAPAGNRFHGAWTAAKICLLIVMIFGAIAAQVHLRAKIERLNKEGTKIRKEINELNILYTNARNKRAMLTSWENIQVQIKRHKLGLRSREYRQVSRLEINTPRRPNKTLRPVRAESASRTPASPRRELAGNDR
ncbi:MAG: hypothetical protein IJS14_14840 [Lentisphaeria bacterium]|nr:hypothetical protein [Lentisphaeria bacterium]